MSGHVFFKERWYGFDDGLYAARGSSRSSRRRRTSQGAERAPESIEHAGAAGAARARRREPSPRRRAAEDARSSRGDRSLTIDGLRVEYPDGFGLIRASNTTPVLELRFEADTQEALSRIQRDFKRVLSTATDAQLPDSKESNHRTGHEANNEEAKWAPAIRDHGRTFPSYRPPAYILIRALSFRWPSLSFVLVCFNS
jgi:hypothetical protein